jgi:hypothetical protein
VLAPVLETEVLVLDESGAQNSAAEGDEEERKDLKVGITDTLSERIGVRMRSRLWEVQNDKDGWKRFQKDG